jgi:hypothetical protein
MRLGINLRGDLAKLNDAEKDVTDEIQRRIRRRQKSAAARVTP